VRAPRLFFVNIDIVSSYFSFTYEFRSSSMKHKLFKMEYLVSCVAFALLFLAHIIPSEAAESVKGTYDYENYKLFDIRGPLVLSCNVTFVPEKPYVLEWLKDDKPVADVPSLQSRYKLLAAENKFVIDRTQESDGGEYTCRPQNASENMFAKITAVGKPVAKLPPNTNVVEGEKLKLICIAMGNPKPVVEWTVGNETYKESRDRIILSDDNGVTNAVLTMAEVTVDDRGDFYCQATNTASRFVNSTKDGTFVRVKDKLAALWPFLGICAEVFVLCAIILVYEKRRNKPDMEESDTDQSPDQKKG